MKEFLDFLGGQSPYDGLSFDDLEKLASAVEVEFFARGSIVVPANSPPLSHLFVIRTGEVEVVDRAVVIDVLGPGDTFGHISVLSGLPPALEVRTVEDTLVYRLPDPRQILAEPETLRFSNYASLISRRRLTQTTLAEASRRPVHRFMRQLVWADATTSLRDAARSMNDAGESCVLVTLANGSLGIATDQDFRRLVAADNPSLDAPVASIATTPVRTVQVDDTVTSAFLEMVEHGVHHLLVTSEAGRPLGFVRVVDLASADVRDPLLVRAAVDAASTISELAEAAALLPATVIELDDYGVPAIQIGALESTVRDHIVRRLVEICDTDADLEGVGLAWLALGSLARRESLPSSDVDTAIIWKPGDEHDDSAEAVRIYAERVLSALETCGFRRCPKGANATNPLFSRSVSDWQESASRWIHDQTSDGLLLLTSIVTDSRGLTDIALARQVTDTLLQAATDRAFLDRLLRFTVQNKPPTGFVRDFVVIHSGKHRGKLDLKKGGLVPIASIGRWLALATGDTRGSTVDRIRRGSDAGLLSTANADAMVVAFEEVYGLLFERELTGLRTGTHLGSRVAPKELDSLTRRFLRDTFREIDHVQGQLLASWLAR